jgi:2-polyprenyl-6-methoxyphenol hydroxylase-like FAD-dependent oxidoreductase
VSTSKNHDQDHHYRRRHCWAGNRHRTCRLKIETLIIEQAPEVGEVGSGISLWSNALKALDALGIAGAVRRRALEEGGGGIRSWRGRLLFQLDLQELRRQLGDVTVILHRAELLSVLRDHATVAEIRLGARCVGFEQNDRRVQALLSERQLC